MKFPNLILIGFCLFCSAFFVPAQDMDTEMSKLTETLSSQLKDNASKKVTVLDFTDLDGNTTELGKYLADQLTVGFVMKKRDFSVLDRANLKRILAEHQLTASGLVDPQNAKKLGAFAGVDAMIFGKAIPLGSKISVTAQIITTDAAEVRGGGKVQFQQDESTRQLMAKKPTEPPTAGATTPTKATPAKPIPKLVKSFADNGWRFEAQSLRIVNGNQYLLTVNFVNQNSTSVGWMALNADQRFGIWTMKSTVFDPEGYEFTAKGDDVSGVGFGYWGYGFTGDPTRCNPRDSLPATIKFSSRPGRGATPGLCRVKVSFYSLRVDGYGKVTGYLEHTIVGEIQTE